MKKLLLVLMVVAMASFLLVGCLPGIGVDGDEEEEVVVEVAVDIADSVVIDGKTYVSAGSHDITVTFPEPATGSVTAYIGLCGGDYSKSLLDDIIAAGGLSIPLWPNEDKTVWSGSGDFYGVGLFASYCCASYVFVTSGECEDEVCLQFPVIVDSCSPYAEIEIGIKDCEYECSPEGCSITFESTEVAPECADTSECCGDDCSGLFSWSMNLYDGWPFDKCCDPTVCEEPIGTCSLNACPIDCETDCLAAGTYYAIITLVDNVGLETNYYAKIVVGGEGTTAAPCTILVYEGTYVGPDECVIFDDVTTDTIGLCFDPDCGNFY
ncbi:hypothetical protein CVT91_06610 [Candidatus Atribacteria bacterium HGW-Atribacteria-1]|nr:MAG: hypothetical protein CVT91_06610 [Candidatus Atribacteria bacterium HGW-Atribacteria-1]